MYRRAGVEEYVDSWEPSLQDIPNISTPTHKREFAVTCPRLCIEINGRDETINQESRLPPPVRPTDSTHAVAYMVKIGHAGREEAEGPEASSLLSL